MDWVHCNNCFILPGSGKRFFLTSCGHIYCIDCKDQCTHELCKLCGNQCNLISLSSQMKPDVEMYFLNPFELLMKQVKDMQQVVEFQNNHRARLFAYQRSQINKMNQLKDNFKKVLKKIKEIESEKQKLKMQNEYYKQIISLHESGNSPNTENLKSFHNISQLRNFQKSSLTDGIQSPAEIGRNSSVRSYYSPASDCSGYSTFPARADSRTPMSNKLGISALNSPDSIISMQNQNRLQKLCLTSPYSPESDNEVLSNSVTGYPKNVTTLSGNKEDKLPYGLSAKYPVKKAAVQPYSQ